MAQTLQKQSRRCGGPADRGDVTFVGSRSPTANSQPAATVVTAGWQEEGRRKAEEEFVKPSRGIGRTMNN